MPHSADLAAQPDQPRPAWLWLGAAADLNVSQQIRLQALADSRRQVERGRSLFCAGDHLVWLYEVHAGTLKTSVSLPDGREQVMGFHTRGDLLGLDALDSGRHTCDTVALEAAEVCPMPYAVLNDLQRDSATLQHLFHCALSREIVRAQAMMRMLGSLRADERVALFLLDMQRRQLDAGLAASPLHLHMSRDDIGSYLGLTLETVSRSFSRFAHEGVLEVHNRQLRILDEPALRRLAHGPG